VPIGNVLRDAAADSGGEVALLALAPGRQPRRWTYGELHDEAERLAGLLLRRFDPGERIALCAPNTPEWLFLQLGASLAGIVVVPVNPAFPDREVERIVRETGVVGLFVGTEGGQRWAGWTGAAGGGLPRLRHVAVLDGDAGAVGDGRAPRELPQVRSADPCRIQYTLGTTGAPKPVVLHHGGWTEDAAAVAEALGAHAGERWINPLPFFHVSGFGPTALAAMQVRAVQVLTPYDPESILLATAAEGAEILSLPPTMLTTLLDHPALGRHDLSALRVVSCGGMSYDMHLAKRVEDRLGARFTMAYGQTEACGITHKIRSDEPDTDSKAGTVGQPLPQIEARVVDQEGRTVGLGAVGEICVRAGQVMTGYLDDPEATAAKIDAEGWLHMGDLGAMDAQGYFRVFGRREETLVHGDEYVFPAEIEAVLQAHPDVVQAAVVGLQGDSTGEVVGFVRARPGSDDGSAILTWCRERLPAQKVPGRLLFVDQFPVTPLGKVQKFVLARQAAA
jgi:fatty-acyl-CoA synthase